MNICLICLDQLWVCENHQTVAWNEGQQACCRGAGAPCRCNKTIPPKLPNGFKILIQNTPNEIDNVD